MLNLISQQPIPLQKFAYDSLARRNSGLESEFNLCCGTLLSKVFIVADLYSQRDPPLLSPHMLRKNTARNMNFIEDLMVQKSPLSSYYKYNLNDCHIRLTSNARKRKALREKMLKFCKWQQSGRDPEPDKVESIENTLILNYSNETQEKKVYLGFTPYIFNETSNSQDKLADTIFSHAIYDSSKCLTPSPCFGSISGGSEHVLKINVYTSNPPTTVRISLTDKEQSWQALTVGCFQDDGIHFILPPYTGNWNYNDENRLIDLKILDVYEGMPRNNIKFVYV